MFKLSLACIWNVTLVGDQFFLTNEDKLQTSEHHNTECTNSIFQRKEIFDIFLLLVACANLLAI